MLDHTYRRPLRVVQACSSIQRSDSESSTDAEFQAKRWPPRTVASLRAKRFLQEQRQNRPQTATLVRPRVLDTCYLTKLDMSLTRKALLNISNLCKNTSKRGNKAPLKAFAKITTSGACMQLRPNHRPLGRSQSEADESWEDEDSSSEVGNRSFSRNKTFVREPNNNVDAKSGAKSPTVGKKGTKRVVPEPCRSCGRSDLPERLHSHPITKGRALCRSQTVPAVTVTRPIKSSVQRPTPIKYKSVSNGKKNSDISVRNKPETKGILKTIFPKPPASPNLGPTKPPHSPKKLAPRPTASPKLSPKPPPSPKPDPLKKSPSTPKLPEKPPASPLTKNLKCPSPKPSSKLSPSSRKKDLSPTRAISPRSFVVMDEKEKKEKPISPKKVDPKPTTKNKSQSCYVCGKEFGSISLSQHEPKCLEKWQKMNSRLPANMQRPLPSKSSKEEWNHFAWQSNQVILCDGCGKSFSPDKILAHQRTCANKANKEDADAPPTSPSKYVVMCSICDRPCGSRSIHIHEAQCAKRQRAENAELTASKGLEEGAEKGSPERRSPQPQQTDCYLCGRTFATLSLPGHEPNCLRKWRQENDKLPPEQRKPEPRPSQNHLRGVLQHEETFAAIYESHLEKLVPCKSCNRTFLPERLEIHQRSCLSKK